jgi:hypothetical protein
LRNPHPRSLQNVFPDHTKRVFKLGYDLDRSVACCPSCPRDSVELVLSGSIERLLPGDGLADLRGQVSEL